MVILDTMTTYSAEEWQDLEGTQMNALCSLTTKYDHFNFSLY